MLTLTITDPHLLTNAERAAVLAFCQITGVDRPQHMLGNDARLPIGEAAAKLAGGLKPEDNPETGLPPAVQAAVESFQKTLDSVSLHLSPVPFPPVVIPIAPPGPALGEADAKRIYEAGLPLDPAAIFGDQAAPAASAATPTPPTPPAPPSAGMPTPPAPAAGTTQTAPSGNAPSSAASVPPAGGSAKELDTKGFPWDHRIHAGTKSKKADGSWTKKKNVDTAVVTAVEAELRALLAIPPAGGVIGAGLPVPGAMPLPPGSMPPTFSDLMQWVTSEIAAGRLTQPDVIESVKPLALTSIVGLDARPDLIPQVRAALQLVVDSRMPKP